MNRLAGTLLSGILVLLLAPAGRPVTAIAQQVGETVVVTMDFETKIRDEKVDKVFAGGVHEVIDVSGSWCAVKNIQGWIPRQYCLKLDEAMKQFSDRVRDNPEDAEAWMTRGMIHLNLKEPAEALQDLDRAVALQPDRPNFRNNRALVLMQLNRIEPAIDELGKAVELAPDYATAWGNRGLCFHAPSRLRRRTAARPRLAGGCAGSGRRRIGSGKPETIRREGRRRSAAESGAAGLLPASRRRGRPRAPGLRPQRPRGWRPRPRPAIRPSWG